MDLVVCRGVVIGNGSVQYARDAGIDVVEE